MINPNKDTCRFGAARCKPNLFFWFFESERLLVNKYCREENGKPGKTLYLL